MGEAGISPTAKAYGCDGPGGWVAFPKEIPKRHALTESVLRVDYPCGRPAKTTLGSSVLSPNLEGSGKEGQRNLCVLDESATGNRADDNEEDAGATVNITVAPGTPAEICLRPQPILQTQTIYANPPTIEDCCSDGRRLDTLEQEVAKIVGPHEEIEMGMKNWAQCQSVCQPLLPKYPCRGVIRSPRPDWPKLSLEERCKPSLVSTREADPEGSKPLTGREFVEGKKTCDLYPIHPNLPPRFNNSEWFKGYGCENPAHPFYMTTSMDYGRFPPTAHTMTQSYYPRQSQFSSNLAKAGMPRNRSLNLANDKTIV